jgi:NifU-like protein
MSEARLSQRVLDGIQPYLARKQKLSLEDRHHKQQPLRELVGVGSEMDLEVTWGGIDATWRVMEALYLEKVRKEGRNHYLIGLAFEVFPHWMRARLEELGVVVEEIAMDADQRIDIEKLKQQITPRTLMLSLSMARKDKGALIEPYLECLQVARQRKLLAHLDLTGVVGILAMDDLSAWDYVTMGDQGLQSGGDLGAIFYDKAAPRVEPSSNSGMWQELGSIALFSAASLALSRLDQRILEGIRLAQMLEQKLQSYFDRSVLRASRELMRAPGTLWVALPKIHPDLYLHYLKVDFDQSNLDISILEDHTLFIEIRPTTTEEDLQKISKRLDQIIPTLQALSRGFAEDMPLIRREPSSFEAPLVTTRLQGLLYVGMIHEEPLPEGLRHVRVEESGMLILDWLVDCTDGVIVDVRYQALGPPALVAAAEALSELCLRKNYDQASRISAHLLDRFYQERRSKEVFSLQDNFWLNRVLSALDKAVYQCLDLPLAPDYSSTPLHKETYSDEPLGEGGIPGWEAMGLEDKLQVIEEVLALDIRPYIALDEGNVQIVRLEEGHQLHIAYQGSCTSCHSATGSTLSAIQSILIAKVHPSLIVIPEL